MTATPEITDDFDLLPRWLDLRTADLVELGCGAAQLARRLLQGHPGLKVTGLEVDPRQHAKNLQTPTERLQFVAAGAEAIPFDGGSFDIALMLKSLHHVPLAEMDRALAEIRRVLRPGGHLYVSEPVAAGALNEVTRLFNDEREVRAAAQAALDRALAGGGWTQAAEQRFETPVHFDNFDDFEQRMVSVTFADHRFDGSVRDDVRRHFEAHQGEHGADFTRPMHVRLLQRT